MDDIALDESSSSSSSSIQQKQQQQNKKQPSSSSLQPPTPTLQQKQQQQQQKQKKIYTEEEEEENNSEQNRLRLNDAMMTDDITTTNNNNKDSSKYHSLPLPEERGNNKNNKDVYQTIAAVTGNILEWYDFAIFGFFSDILSEVFFPPQAGHAAVVETFIIFGAAFLMRPVGGIIMGHIGDKYGRKRALETSIFLMAFPTFAMGCLPTYKTVGSFAIVLLSIVRLLQGLSVGGQLMSSLVFTLESHPRKEWGFYGSFVMAGANFGTLLGAIIGYIMRSNLSENELRLWGWRLPFLSGIVISISGFYLKFYGTEDPLHQQLHHHHNSSSLQQQQQQHHQQQHHQQQHHQQQQKQQNPFLLAIRWENLQMLLSCSLVPMIWSSGFYIFFVWMAVYMQELMNPPIPGAFAINSLSLFWSLCLFFPIAGILTDKFFYHRPQLLMIGSGLGMAILSPIAMYLISQGNPIIAFLCQSILGILISFWGAPMCVWLVQQFPPESRLTSVSIGYNVAQSLVGGSSPALATILLDRKGELGPGYMLMGIAILSVLGLFIAPSSYNYNNDDDGNGNGNGGGGNGDEEEQVEMFSSKEMVPEKMNVHAFT